MAMAVLCVMLIIMSVFLIKCVKKLKNGSVMRKITLISAFFACLVICADDISVVVQSLIQPLKVGASEPVHGTVAGLEYVDKKLANGMRVVGIRQPAVKGRVVVELAFCGVGASIEQSNQKGLAHLIEHMLFKGTDSTLQEGAFSKIVSKYGGTSNAFTSFDSTCYYVSLDSANWQPIVKLYADCMQNSAMNAQHLASELKVVIKELRRNDDNPMWIWFQKMFKTSLPSNHPHYSCIIGDRQDLAALTADNLKKFFKTYYHPDVATLFVVGDINPEDAVAYVASEMEQIPSGNVVLPDRSSEKFEVKKGFHEVVYDESSTNTVVLCWHLPGRSKHIDSATHMLASVLSSNANAVLSKLLVHEKKMVSDVTAFSWMYKDSGYFFVVMNPFDGQLEASVELVHAELAKIAEFGVDEGLLAQIVARERVGQARALESMVRDGGGINPDWLERYSRYGALEDCFDEVSDLAKVTSVDIQECAKRFLTQVDAMRVDIVPMTDEARVEKTQKLIEQQALEDVITSAHQRTLPLVEAEMPAGYPEHQPVHPTFVDSRKTTVLENGLTIVTSQNVSSSLCHFQLSHKQTEFIQNTIDASLLTILAEMIVQGTEDMTREEITEWFSSRAISYTATSILSLKEQFLPAIQKLFSILFSAQFTAQDLEKVKAQITNSIKDMQSDVKSRADRISQQQVYQNTPRAYAWEELLQRIDGLSVDSLRALFVEHFDPSKMVAFVAADCAHEDVVAVIRDATVAWKPGLGKEYAFIVDSSLKPELVVNEQLLKDQVWIQFIRSSTINARDKELFALNVISEILDNRFFKLREGSDMFYVVAMALARNGTRTIPGFDIAISQTGTELLDRAFALFDRFFTEDALKPISEEELASAKTSIKSLYMNRFAGLDGELAFCKELTVNGVDANFYAQGMQDIDAMTLESANQLLKDYISRAPFTRICVGNLKK